MDGYMWFIAGALFLYFCCKIKDFFKSDCSNGIRSWWGQYF